MSLLADRVAVLFFDALVADADKATPARPPSKGGIRRSGVKAAKGAAASRVAPASERTNAGAVAACCRKAGGEAALWRMRAHVAQVLQAEAEERVAVVGSARGGKREVGKREGEDVQEGERGKERKCAALEKEVAAKDEVVERLVAEAEVRDGAVKRLQAEVGVKSEAIAGFEARMGAAVSALQVQIAGLTEDCQRKDMQVAGAMQELVDAAVAAEARFLGVEAGHRAAVAHLEANLVRAGQDLARHVALNDEARADEARAAEKVQQLKAELVDRDAATAADQTTLAACLDAREADVQAMAAVVGEAADEILRLDAAVAERDAKLKARGADLDDARRQAEERTGAAEARFQAARDRNKAQVAALEARLRALGTEVARLGESVRRAEGRAKRAEALLVKETASAVAAGEAAEEMRVRVVAVEECRREARDEVSAVQAEVEMMAAAAQEGTACHQVAVEALEGRVQTLGRELAGRDEAIRRAGRKTKIAQEALAKEAAGAEAAFEGMEKMRVRAQALEESLCHDREEASVAEEEYRKEAAAVRELHRSAEVKVRALETKILALGGELACRSNAIRCADQKVTLAQASLATEAAGAESARKAVEEMRVCLAKMEESQHASGKKAIAAEAQLKKLATEVRERRRYEEAKVDGLESKVQSLGFQLAGREDALRLAVQRATLAEASLAIEAAGAESARATAEKMRVRVVETNKRSDEVSVRVIAMERKLEDVAQLSKLQLSAAQAEIARLSAAAAAAAESSKADTFKASGTAAEMARLRLEVERSERSASQAQADAATLSDQLLCVTNELEARAAQNENLRAELSSLNMRMRRMDVMSLPPGAAELLVESGDTASAKVLGLLTDEERKCRRSGMRGDKATAKMLSIRIAEERASRCGAGVVLESIGGRENKPASRAE